MADRKPLATDILIVGAGPAGGSLAAFLTQYGISGVVISSASSRAATTRAHITNLSALDALRDVGLADECYKLGHKEEMRHYRWGETLAEEEYARICSWGHQKERKGDYEAASPNPGLIDLPQTLLEPILIRHATINGFKVLFNTEFLSFTRDAGTGLYTVLVKDRLREEDYQIQCRYLFGADGGRSPIASQLELPFKVGPGLGLGVNVHIKCDIAHLMKGREGNLHWNLRLKRADNWMLNARMVKPWNEWLLGAIPKDPADPGEPWTKEQWEAAWRDLINDWDCKVEILDMSHWKLNNMIAEKYSDGNVFCLGDAVHRHPPFNGLGSNTCIGDAYNLAWKLNLVMKGIASASLLDTYNAERQPVGAQVVESTSSRLFQHAALLGLILRPGSTIEERTAGVRLLKEDSELGRETRKKFRDACLDIYHETHALGLEMGQRYVSTAVYLADEKEPYTPTGKEAGNSVLYYESSTYPGRRLPHVWLAQDPVDKYVSTLDLAGKGSFTLFTGIGGQTWVIAAQSVAKALNVPLRAVSIGYGQDWEDTYFDWSLKRGVEDSGCVLVRPDLFVAWRANLHLSSQEEATTKLLVVMKSILGF